MLLTIDKTSHEPLYQQIYRQIVAGIATRALRPADPLPTVRALAGDLGINMHTVHKAYTLLKDDGYITMRGRAGAAIAEPDPGNDAEQDAPARRMLEELHALALAYRARGRSMSEFLDDAASQAAQAYASTTGPTTRLAKAQ